MKSASRTGLSIRVKLFLVIGTLLAIVTAALSGAAYREMRASGLASTTAHLDGIALQWARLFEGSTDRQRVLLRALRESPFIQAGVASSDAQARSNATAALRAILPNGQPSVLQLLDSNGVELARVGNDTIVPSTAVIRQVITAVAAIDSGAIAPLRAEGAAMLTASVIRVKTADGGVRGYVMQTTRVHVTPSPETLNRLFGGEATQMRLANRDGSLWTDLEKPIPAPAVDSIRTGVLMSYASAVSGQPVFAVFRPVAGTPYLVVLETNQAAVLAEARRFLGRLLLEGAVVIVLGLLVAIWFSGSFTKPIAQLRTAVESIAAGDYSHHVALAPRGDEFGQLSGAFDTMVAHVQAAFTSQQAAEENHRALFESVPLPLWVFDMETLRFVAVNNAALHHYGYEREDFLSMAVTEIRPTEDVARFLASVRNIDGPSYGGEWRHRKKDGTLIDVETHARSIDFHGRPSRIVLIHDITERKRAKELIQRQDERYRRLVEHSPDGITLTTTDGRFMAVNPAFSSMLGYESSEELLALDAMAVFPTPKDRETLVAKLYKAGTLHRHEVQLKRKNGSLITTLCTARFVTDPDSGEQYLEVVTEDVTDLRRVERQFLQAQKMEAVGQLAGGVAHDFNNLLTVILSYSDILLTELPPAASHRSDVEAIRDAGRSAATLTRQLLVFGRQQIIEPKVMRLNDLVTDTAKMLTRLLGEHVELTTMLDSATGAVKIDAGQMEQVIVNLAVNARDAMPNGGRLLIESRNVDFDPPISDRETVHTAGPHVMLSVSDNGVGMDASVQARVFEPFFTTKAAGKGTGLGLATVYGIVKQNGGQIAVYSEPGRGTSFKMYFPRFDEVSAERELPSATPELAGGTETILLVEDQPAVLEIARTVLVRTGYRVVEASDGHHALDLASKHNGRIDLLVTDVVMPRMNGRELADQFSRLRPRAGILFVSGYTDDAIVLHGVLEREMHFLQKPFTPAALLRKVRMVLDRAAQEDVDHMVITAANRDRLQHSER
ncbi:MAG: PAS domain S-box protein [bacterium]